MKLALAKYDTNEDWYRIIRAEHDGREWWEATGPNSARLMMSERLKDACIEGPFYEMVEIAKAIKSNGSVSFKRCAVKKDSEGFQFCSPRNSRGWAFVPDEDAQDLADIILNEHKNVNMLTTSEDR